MATIDDRIALDFSDVLIRPAYSEIQSRSLVDVSTEIGNLHLKIPIISANMESIFSVKMGIVLSQLGGAAVMHRYADTNTVVGWINELKKANAITIPSVGVQKEDYDRARLYYEMGVDAVCIDVAHGDSSFALNMTGFCSKLGYQTVIAGNVATSEGVKRLWESGANVIKVGIGSSKICDTRLVAGVGVPQLTAIMECAEEAYKLVNCFIISDGGTSMASDMVKGLSAGADCFMLGTLLAGTDEGPEHVKTPNGYVFRGMASKDAQELYRGKVSNDAPEGNSIVVKPKGPVEDVIKVLIGGIRSGCSYVGASNLEELREFTILQRVNRIK